MSYHSVTILQFYTRQMLAASWGEPEACQYAIVSCYISRKVCEESAEEFRLVKRKGTKYSWRWQWETEGVVIEGLSLISWLLSVYKFNIFFLYKYTYDCCTSSVFRLIICIYSRCLSIRSCLCSGVSAALCNLYNSLLRASLYAHEQDHLQQDYPSTGWTPRANTELFKYSVIYTGILVLHRVMNCPTNIYGSSVIYAVDLYRVMNYPTNI